MLSKHDSRSSVVRRLFYSASVPAKKQIVKSSKRQFVVRLDQDGLYSRLLEMSLERSRQEGRRVPMTLIVREAIETYLEA